MPRVPCNRNDNEAESAEAEPLRCRRASYASALQLRPSNTVSSAEQNMSYIQPVFDLVKPISLDFQTNLLGVFQALYEDDCEPISFFAVVRAFSALQPSGDALQHFNDKWVKKSGLQKLRGAGIDTITGKSSITGAMAKTREGKIALLIISLLIDALGANITSSLAYEIISATADVQPETQPTRTKVARVISAIQSQIRHVSWHQEIMNAQGYVHNQAADRVQGQRTLFNVPEEAMKIFYQVLCTVSRFPNDYHCILQTTCSITLAFVLAHSICGLQICVVVDGIVVYGNAILGHWHVKLDKKQESAEQDCTEIKLGHKLQDPDVLLTTTGVGPLLEVEQVDADKTRKRTQGDDRGDSPIIDVLGNDDNCTDSERSWAASSLWDTQNSVGSSATSGLPTGIMRISIQKLADVVLDEAGLTTILEAALPYPYLREDLLEEFKRLMRCYYRDVKDSSSTPDHMKVIQLFKKSKSTITSRVKQTLGLNYAESMLLERGKKLSQQEKKEITLRLLHKQDVLENPPTKGLMDNGTHDASSENDSEDDNNFADDLYPGISAAIAFLKHGSPMQIFQANTCQFILNAIREHDVLQSPRSLPRSLPNIVDDIWRRICPNLPEEDIPRGRRRIRWTCSCGLKMYDDFDELVDGAVLDDLETRLNRNNFTQHSNASGNAVSQVLKWSVRHAQLLKSHLWGQPVKNDALPTHHARIATAVDEAAPESHSANLLYLLHCNSTGEHGVKLHQDLIHYKLNDQELFRFLRTVYCRARKGTKWFTLRNTTSISLCKFFVDHSHHASVQKHGYECMQQFHNCICLPPRDLVGREYQCHPTPPDPMPLPPFEKNYLMHYFLNPHHLSPDQVWAYTQLPKRMNFPLEPGADSFLPGWGIYFEDGWNFKTIYLLISLATIIGSLIFGICWSILKLDVQAAFGITSYWVATVAMGLGFLALRSTDKL